MGTKQSPHPPSCPRATESTYQHEHEKRIPVDSLIMARKHTYIYIDIYICNGSIWIVEYSKVQCCLIFCKSSSALFTRKILEKLVFIIILESKTQVSLISPFLLACLAWYASFTRVLVRSSPMCIFVPSSMASGLGLALSTSGWSEEPLPVSARWWGCVSPSSPSLPLGCCFRSFFLAAMTRFLIRRVANFTSSGRGRGRGSDPSSSGGFLGLPTRWDTEISLRVRGGFSFILMLQSRKTLSSVLPGLSLDRPKILTESRLPCCSWLSTITCSSATSFCSAVIFLSFSCPSDFKTLTVWVSACTVSSSRLVIGSKRDWNIGLKWAYNALQSLYPPGLPALNFWTPPW